ncbi:putative histidine kinase response regulator and transcription factor RR-A-type family [Lupinus albus]|uniref:histidine kinase n=1 Tax=Lupinus albus TaxID=3870 RepID=A0A6A4PI31_LUPAL|nr:putative histidine kinase response regulator and transcription factor RR-A-type family [Lupinus albus]
MGEIGFVSKPKVGSTFTFITVFANGLPSSNECKTQQIINQPHLASSEFEGMTAMIIDHRPVRAKVSRYHIQRLGIHVEMVSDFNQGLSALTNENMVINMVLIEQEVGDKDSGCHLTCPHYNHARWVFRNKGTPRNGDLPSLSLRHLFRGRRILIVDDNSVNRMVAAATLKKYGAEVVCVSSGKEAISSLKPPHQFDACFMDIQMPEMDGFEATRTIRDMELSTNNEVSVDDFDNVSNWHVPIVAMTADVIQATQEECLKCGMDGYVSKPFEVEQLYREVSWVFQSS